MIILTACAIGIFAAAMRSAFACMLVGCLVLCVFAAASVVSATFPLLSLVLAIVGYNAGIASILGLELARGKFATH